MSPLDVINGGARWAMICGDNREILPTLPDGSVAHVITDPPYSEHTHSKQRRVISTQTDAPNPYTKRGGGAVVEVALGFPSITQESRVACAASFAILVKRWCVVFSDLENTENWLATLSAAGLRRWRFGIWNKLNCSPQFSGTGPAVGSEGIAIAHSAAAMRWNGGGLPARWDFAIMNGDPDRAHTTQKPLDLMMRLVELFTDPGDIVLDPFAGSGTTGVACLRLGRRFIGCEIDPRYAAIATERLQAEERGLSLREARAGQTTFADLLGAK